MLTVQHSGVHCLLRKMGLKSWTIHSIKWSPLGKLGFGGVKDLPPSDE